MRYWQHWKSHDSRFLSSVTHHPIPFPLSIGTGAGTTSPLPGIPGTLTHCDGFRSVAGVLKVLLVQQGRSGQQPSQAPPSRGERSGMTAQADSGSIQPRLVFCKNSWAKDQPKSSWPAETACRADSYSKAVVWVALKFTGSPELHKFPAGALQVRESEAPWPQQLSLTPPMPDEGAAEAGQQQQPVRTPRVELLALWLDLASSYRRDQQLHRSDFTIALQSVSVSVEGAFEGGAMPLQDFSFSFGEHPRVWDAADAVVVDARGQLGSVMPQINTFPMHTFPLAGKTKYWELKWDMHDYIYQDKRISNQFDANGKWVGPGNGCSGGIYRHYGGSSSIEAVLGNLL